MNGILIIDKPQNMTSHDVVSILRKKTGIKKIGHSGTLDPMATGVLPVFIGKATRIIEFSSIPGDPEAKIYICRMKLGIETNTQDIWGSPLNDSKSSNSIDSITFHGSPESFSSRVSFKMPEEEEILCVLKGFEGPGTQRPPMYSSVKVDGRKLYEYARKGQSPDSSKIKEREIYIKQIYVNHIIPETGDVEFDVHCSKGVYIRTLCADAGRKLGCGAVMSGLRRIKSDGFCIEDAVQLDQIDQIEHIDQLEQLNQSKKTNHIEKCGTSKVRLFSVDAPLEWMPRIDLPTQTANRFIVGQKIDLLTLENSFREYLTDDDNSAFTDKHKAAHANNPIVRVYCESSFLGVGKVIENSLLKPEKVLV